MLLYSYNNNHSSRARSLRRKQTEAERVLWMKIRARQLQGYKFRRQHPIDNYILDFYCKEKRLAIELDGSGHTNSIQKVYDQQRSLTLKSLDIFVTRFWDNDVLTDINNVLEVIRRHLV